MENNDELDLDDGYVSPTNPTIEDYRALEKKNRQLYARVKKGAPKPADTTTTPAPAAATTTAAAPASVSEDAAWKERMELKTEGYSDEEIAYLQQSGGRKALENTYVKATIDTMRNQKKAEVAAVETTAGKSEVEKQFTDAQLREMPTAELEKILPKAQQ
jgi:hypothetical protein